MIYRPKSLQKQLLEQFASLKAFRSEFRINSSTKKILEIRSGALDRQENFWATRSKSVWPVKFLTNLAGKNFRLSDFSEDERLPMFKRRDWIESDIALYFIGILLCFILYERWGVEKLLGEGQCRIRKESGESLI